MTSPGKLIWHKAGIAIMYLGGDEFLWGETCVSLPIVLSNLAGDL